jgi:hypothetical protein
MRSCFQGILLAALMSVSEAESLILGETSILDPGFRQRIDVAIGQQLLV